MREILFRGKAANRKSNQAYRTCYKNGDWVYGLLSKTENYAGFAEMTNTDGVSGIEVDKNTVGQYTGLTDKNSTKIFEGDILEYQIRFKDGSKKSFRAEVKAEAMSFGAYHKVYGFCAYLEFGDMENSEIIGNIHDNPELLKGGEGDG